MNASFFSLVWCELGVDNGKVGSKGKKNPALVLTLELEERGIFKEDIYGEVKKLTKRKITKLFRDRLIEVFMHASFIVLDEKIVNLEEIIKCVL